MGFQRFGSIVGILILGWLAGCDMDRKASIETVNEGLAVIEHRGHLAAVPFFEAAIEQDPTHALAHHYLGMFRLQHGNDAERALDPLARAVQLDPDDAAFRYQFGIALMRLGYTEQAREEFAHTLRIDPRHAEAAWRLGELSWTAGDLLEAIDRFVQSIHARPDFDLPYNSLGNLYLQYGRTQEAIRVFENGIALGADPTRNYADLGRLYLQAGEPDLAISYLRQAAERPGAPASIYYNIGMALRDRYQRAGRAEDRQDAERYLRRAQGGCNPQREAARCSALQSVLRELTRGQ